MAQIRSTFREHRHFFIVVPLLILIMTYPTIRYVLDANVFWLPIDSGDIWIKFWDAWYAQSIIAGQAEFYHTDFLFYPRGVSLAYHILTIPHIIIFGSLQLLMPASNAYNLTYLFIIFSAASSAYVYILYLLKDKWVSLFGAVIFGLSGYIVGRAPHPGETFLLTLPLALYFFHRAILENRWLFICIAGCLIGASAFIGMYIFVCLLMLSGAYAFCFALSRWKNPSFWLKIILLFVIIGSISIFRIAPMLADAQDLDSILDKTSGLEQENDLLQFFLNYENPITNRLITNRITTTFIKLSTPGRWNSSYLGYVPLILIGLGLCGAAYRRKMLPWLLLALPFLILRLGSVLTINNQPFPSIRLPKYYLDDLFPTVFEAFYATDHFQIGVLLPLAVLSCYGLMRVLQSVPAQRHSQIILIAIALVAIEYYRLPPDGRIVTEDEIAFLDWLSREENQDAIRLINLPMNRGHSKLYLLYQTMSGYPQVEGLATRTPSDAYTYIRENHLLNEWHSNARVRCSAGNQEVYLSALDALTRDGFSHIVLHHSRLRENNAGVFESFSHIAPSYPNGYTDEWVSIYRLQDLRESCP